MAEQKKILVLESENLLAAGIVSMLVSKLGISVAGTTAVSLASLGQLCSSQPDVVILDEELLAANILALIQLTDCYPKLRLIILSIKDSSVNIFDKQTIQIRKPSDFIDLLES